MVFELKSESAADGSLFITTLLAGGLSVMILAYERGSVEFCEVVLSTIEVLLESVVLSTMVLFGGSTGLLVVVLLLFWVDEVLFERELLVAVLLVTVLFAPVLFVSGRVVAE